MAGLKVARGRSSGNVPEVSPASFREFRDRLFRWWSKHRRQFPWRSERDPYRVLIAELLLRRTQANQVVPVYEEFVRQFPDPATLARAKPKRIRGILHPLGLHWRAENVVRLASDLQNRGSCALRDPSSVRSLPGVGDYVSAAVSCFAFDERVPVIDTNTSRVVARFFGIAPKPELRRDARVRILLERLVREGNARNLNLAIIDLAALLCRPRLPVCSQCPLDQACRKEGVAEWS